MSVSFGCYIHIPYCRQKCRYCDFVSRPFDHDDADAYTDALCRELSRYVGTPVTSVFIGGGTPSVLSENCTEKVLAAIWSSLDLSSVAEVTVEGNPESLTPKYLAILRSRGVTRLSIGVQSFNDRELEFLGRIHTAGEACNAYRAARSAGFDRVNIDLIYGLPGQPLKVWQDTLKKAVDLYPEHLSLYPLTIEEGTPFAVHGVATDDARTVDLYEWSMDYLEECGFVHYEISNWARPGQECRHNLNYWHNGRYIGVGAAAASYFNGMRRKNTDDIDKYISVMAADGDPVVEHDMINETTRVSEEIILGLRCREGIVLSPEAQEHYRPVIERFAVEGLLEVEGRRIRLARKGLMLANRVMSEFTQNA